MVGFVGRLCHQKAPERLVEAARLGNSSVHFALLGDGEDRGSVQALIMHYGLEARVKLIAGEDGQKSMPAFDLLAVPSRYESMGYIFLEAVAAKIPILATKTGIAGDIIKPGSNGDFVPNTDDPFTWVEAIDSALATAYPAERDDILVRFSADRMVSEILASYREDALQPEGRL